MQVETLLDLDGLLIQGPLLVKPKIFADNRGCFLESWNQRTWKSILASNEQEVGNFVQDNHSSSEQGVLRGLHYQLEPNPQGKLVRCVVGEIFDVAIDLRKRSPTFAKWVGVHLTAINHHQLWIPVGFAHGFMTISPQADVLYKTTGFWSREYERAVAWNDPELDIQWPEINCLPQLSDKDSTAPNLAMVSKDELFE